MREVRNVRAGVQGGMRGREGGQGRPVALRALLRLHLGLPQGRNPLDGKEGCEMKGRMLRYALTALVAALAVWGVVAVHNWNARRAKVAERRAELVRLGLRRA